MRLVALIGLVVTLAGCAGGSTVSQYVGTPNHLLPRDHANYQAQTLKLRAAATHREQDVSVTGAVHSNDMAWLETENVRLARVITICKFCLPERPTPGPSYQPIIATGR